MKLEGPKKTRSAGSAKKSSSASDEGVDFSQYIKSGQDSQSVATTKAITNVDSLLAVQAAENPTERAARKRMRERSNSIIEGLENIRTAMLTGNLTVGHMIDIADVVASHREKVQDPKLTDIMDEIDLRAQVELAKMRIALNE